MPTSRRLEIEAIILTAQRLDERVADRFAERGISRLAGDLVAVARETKRRVADLKRPRWSVRLGTVFIVVLAIGVLALSASRLRSGAHVDGVNDWLELLQAGIQDIVFLGIGAVFLTTLEGRLNRRPALAGLHELRSLAHVIDMHQLTKDPDALLSPTRAAEHSPERRDGRFELARYLEYCSEMLAIINKLAALYAQDTQDPIVLGAVRDVQDLVGMLSAKIWQKLVILDTVAAAER